MVDIKNLFKKARAMRKVKRMMSGICEPCQRIMLESYQRNRGDQKATVADLEGKICPECAKMLCGETNGILNGMGNLGK